MPIIGKLIKKATEISYKRNQNKAQDFENQVQTLTKLLEKAKNTRFGKQYEFKEVLNSGVVDAFQAKVPITDYNKYHHEWIVPAMAGQRDVIWPGRVRHYALSSGTTGSPSKRIPVTVSMIRSFQKTSIKQLATLHALDLSEDVFSASVLAVGGSTKLVKKPTHIEGDLSGILKRYTSKVAAPFTKPPQKIARIKDWNEKLDMMVEKAPEWNIGIMAGVPSWCLMLLERIIKKYDLNHIHELWPNLSVYVHGGVFMEPYKERFEKLIGKKVHLLDTYLASEGYFGFQVDPNEPGMELLLENGVFFEFVPFTSEYFDENGALLDDFKAYTIDEIEENEDYALIISTNAGLWRYMIGDLVRLIDREKNEIVITGRIKQFLSLVGEHLSLDNINMAVLASSKELNLEIREFSILPLHDQLKHRWFLGIDKAVDADLVMQRIDEHLCRLNDDYAAVRKYSLGNPEVYVIPTDKFYEFLDSKGKAGSQSKFPRVMNKEQKEEWMSFISV